MTTTFQGSLQGLRQANRDRLLGLLRDHGELRRAELARRAGVSRTTVGTIVAELLDDGLIVEAGAGAPGGTDGPPARAGDRPTHRHTGALTLNPAAGAAIGVDFSLGTVRVVVADLAHTVLRSGSAALADALDWPERLDVGAALAERLLAEAGMDLQRVVGVGLGMPGPIDERTGQVGASSNSLVWEGVRAAEEFGRRLPAPVALDNTSHLGSLAEVVWGAGQGARNVIYLKLSTGVGAGFMIDGRVYRGAVGAAGELGHTTVDESGPSCRCGNRGCLEVYTSVPAVLELLRPAFGELTIGHAIAMALGGHRACQRVFGDTGRLLGRALSGVCNLLNPELVIVGGDLAKAGDLLLEPLRAAVERHALAIVADSLRIVAGQLGDDAGALGGVALVLREAERLTATA